MVAFNVCVAESFDNIECCMDEVCSVLATVAVLSDQRSDTT